MMNKTVYVTGFGKFNGVDNNPSELIVKSLDNSDLDGIDIIKEILEVSVEGCQESKVYQYQKDNNHNECIYLHIGVDSSSTCYKFESYGYNLCDFRCPDERGNQPLRTPIINNKSFDESISTCFPLHELKDTLRNEGYNVEVSNDPGRFLCNYIYYQSSYQNQINDNNAGVLFIHVPPESVFSINEQKQFITRTIHLLHKSKKKFSDYNTIPPKHFCHKLKKDGRKIVDVIVCGLGGHGSAAVAHIAKKNASVIGFEQASKTTHHHGSSHGRSRIIRQAYFEDPRYVPLLKRSFELWRELEVEYETNDKAEYEKTNEKLLNMTGGIMIGKQNSVVITGTRASIEIHNLPHEILSANDIRNRFPAFNVKDDEIGLLEKEAGYLVPELCVDAYRNMAERYGAELHYDEKVISWHTEKCNIDLGDAIVEEDIVFVETSSGNTYLTKKFIISAGPWAPELYGNQLPDGKANKLSVERRVLFWFEPTNGLDVFKSIPIYIWDIEDEGNFYGFPFQEGPPGGVKVAMHFVDPNIQTNCTPDSIDRNVSSSEITSMRNVIENRMPNLNGKLISTATCMYTCTEDEHFLIDYLPNTNNIIVASPCSGHGFKFCSCIGEILSEIALDGTTRHDISLFQLRNS